jgi:hypothetical protein
MSTWTYDESRSTWTNPNKPKHDIYKTRSANGYVYTVRKNRIIDFVCDTLTEAINYANKAK